MMTNQKSEELRIILDNSSSGIFGIDTNGLCVFANKACLELLGHSGATEVVGRNIHEFILPSREDGSSIDEQESPIFLSLISKSDTYVEQAAFQTKDKRHIQVEYWVRHAKHDNRASIAVVTFNSVEAHLEKQAKLHLFTRATEGVMSPIALGDDSGKLTYVNPSFLEMWGYKNESDVLGRSALDLWNYMGNEEDMYREMNEKGSWKGEIQGYHSSGEHFYGCAMTSSFRKENGDIEGLLATFTDLGKYRKVAESKERLQDIIEATPDLVAVIDQAGKINYLNEGGMQLLGLNPKNCSHCNLLEFMSRVDAEKLLSRLSDISTGRWICDATFIAGDMQEIPMSMTVISHTENDVSGKHYVSVIARDISSYRKLIFDLQTSEETFSKAQEIAHIGNWDWNIITNDLSWSDEIFRIFGLTPQVFKATYPAFLESIHTEDRDDVVAAVNAAVADANIPYSIEHRVVRPDGKIRIVHERGKVYRDEAGKPIRMLGTVHDITERKQKEEEIRKLNEGLERRVQERTRELQDEIQVRKLAESALINAKEKAELYLSIAGAIIVALDTKGIVTLINEQGKKTLGFKEDEIVGKNWFDTVIAEEVREPMKAAFKELIAGDGPMHMTFENEVIDKSGVTHLISWANSLLKNEQGRVVGTLSSGSDITEERVAEEALRIAKEEAEKSSAELKKSLEILRQTQAHLVESEKMASLGGLVAGVAHEINTPVGVGVSASTHLADQTRKYNDLYKQGKLTQAQFEKFLDVALVSTEMIETNLIRAADLIRSFKQVAVDQTNEQTRRVNLKNYISEVVVSLSPRLRRTSHIVTLSGDENIELDTYPGSISQIVTNLVLNSLLHGFEGRERGQVRIDVARQGSVIVIVYNDNGVGMPKENVKRVFDPFFTTKRGQGGSGLGMHIIYNIVTLKLRGMISMTSEPGQGVQVKIEIPES